MEHQFNWEDRFIHSPIVIDDDLDNESRKQTVRNLLDSPTCPYKERCREKNSKIEKYTQWICCPDPPHELCHQFLRWEQRFSLHDILEQECCNC